MSRKHWSDLFLIAAAACVVLAGTITGHSRFIALAALPLCLFAGTAARRRMI